MNEEEAKKWAKDKANQNKVVRAFFRKNKPTRVKIAFFMTGIPGAGKTEFTQNAIRESSPELISIEHDQLVEYIDGYKPESYYNYRKAGSILVTRIFEECLKSGYTFVMGRCLIKTALGTSISVSSLAIELWSYTLFKIQEWRGSSHKLVNWSKNVPSKRRVL